MEWNLMFEDEGKKNWSEKWSLDGLRADVRNTNKGMIFEAGPYPNDHGSMAVLWTKQTFAGNVKIEFDYTRLDSINRFVNILYLQATGIGGEFPSDITTWADKREIPYMSSYFKNMNLLHVSYAAFANHNDDAEDYIRARTYPVPNSPDETNEIGEALFNSGVFLPGEPYHITCIKTEKVMEFLVEGKTSASIKWDISHLPPLAPGPIGIRHMNCRCSRYGNVKIYTS